MAVGQPARVFRFGPFEAHSGTRQLLKNGVSLSLRGQPFEVLAQLLEHPGQLVTREELRTRLWPSGTVVEFDHGINSAVTRLREALGEDAQHPRFIATVPRHGYRFIGPVSASAALGAVVPVEHTVWVPSARRAYRRPVSRAPSLGWVTMAVIGVVLTYVGVQKLWISKHAPHARRD